MFQTNNEAATAALVTGAMVMALLAIFGEIPLRGSIGGLNWDLARRLLRSGDARVAEEAAKEVLAEAGRSRIPSDLVETAQSSLVQASLDYERTVLSTLRRIAMDEGFDVTIGDRRGPDLTLRKGEQLVVVEVRTGRMNAGLAHNLGYRLRGFVSSLVDAHPRATNPSVLLITPECSPLFEARIRNLLPEGVKLHLVVWAGTDGNEAQLEQAVRAALK